MGEFEQDLAAEIKEIGEKYEEKGYFRRLGDMFAGLGQPHDTPEYKNARTELQRQAAPLIAIVSVVLFVVTLIVVTAMTTSSDKGYEVKVQQIEEETPIEEKQDEDPEPPPDPEPQPMEDVDIQLDTPTPGPITDVTPMPSPPSNQVSVKPAPQDTVAFVNSPVKMKSMVGSRTPGSIGAATRGGAGYGDPNTEAAVLKVLWWLKNTQRTDQNNPEDGFWSGGASTLANTALAVLTYLAHGEYPGSESPYRRDFGPVVQKAINHLVNSITTGGTPHMRGADGNEYAFLIATYALCEAYGMTKNPNCKEAAMTCLERIVKGQSPTGGWDYKINPQSTRDDMSFAGWALQALKAGKMAGLHPEGLDECIKKAVKCLKTRNFKNGGFNYTAGGNPTGLTATGCLAMQLLGYGGQPEVNQALEYMRDWQPTFDKSQLSATKTTGACPQYYCYYATQCKYQAGMKQGATKKDETTWHNWNAAMKKLYPASIIDDPGMVKDYKGGEHKQGHYVNQDAHTSRPVMDSCLAALQLMVYYRYLPTNQLKAGQENAADEGGDIGGGDKNDINVEVDI